MTLIIAYLILTSALGFMGLVTLAQVFLFEARLPATMGLIEVFWLLVSIAALSLLPLSPAAALVAQYSIGATIGLSVAFVLWSRRQNIDSFELYPTWFIRGSLCYYLGLIGLTVNALQAYQATGQATLSPQDVFALLPWLFAAASLLLGAFLGSRAFVLASKNEAQYQAQAAIRSHPICQETFGEISFIEPMEEESLWYCEHAISSFWVEGDRAAGHLVARFSSTSDELERLCDGHIQLDNGVAIALTGDGMTA